LHDIELSLRGRLRGFGLKVGKTIPKTFEGRVRTPVADHPTLTMIAEALLRARAVLLEEFILTAVAWPHHSCLRLRMSADLPSRSAAFRKPPA
jgi:hypothetical protein